MIRRSEEHTSELQSRLHLVCRLLLEKKKKSSHTDYPSCFTFFFNDTAPTEIYTLSLHDALPISLPGPPRCSRRHGPTTPPPATGSGRPDRPSRRRRHRCCRTRGRPAATRR